MPDWLSKRKANLFLTSVMFRAINIPTYLRERSGCVVECLTRDRGAADSSLTGVNALCPWARTLILANNKQKRLIFLRYPINFKICKIIMELYEVQQAKPLVIRLKATPRGSQFTLRTCFVHTSECFLTKIPSELKTFLYTCMYSKTSLLKAATQKQTEQRS